MQIAASESRNNHPVTDRAAHASPAVPVRRHRAAARASAYARARRLLVPAIGLCLLWASGCMPNHEQHLAFEGFTAGGQKFRILRDLSWWGRMYSRPRYDRLTVTWPQVNTGNSETGSDSTADTNAQADPAGGDASPTGREAHPTGHGGDAHHAGGDADPTVTSRSEILVENDAAQYLGFHVRSTANRIWLLAAGGGPPFAAMDFDGPEVFPADQPLPQWAEPLGGMQVSNLAPEALATHGIPTMRAPTDTLEALDGRRRTLWAKRPGVVTVLNFFGVNCAPCRMEAPHLAELQRAFGDAGVEVVFVNAWNDAASAVGEYAGKYQLAPGQVLLNGRSLAGRMAVNGVPKTFWINSEGWVTDIQDGFDAGGAGDLLERTRKSLDQAR